MTTGMRSSSSRDIVRELERRRAARERARGTTRLDDEDDEDDGEDGTTRFVDAMETMTGDDDDERMTESWSSSSVSSSSSSSPSSSSSSSYASTREDAFEENRATRSKRTVFGWGEPVSEARIREREARRALARALVSGDAWGDETWPPPPPPTRDSRDVRGSRDSRTTLDGRGRPVRSSEASSEADESEDAAKARRRRRRRAREREHVARLRRGDMR